MTTGNDPALPPVQDQSTPPAPSQDTPAAGSGIAFLPPVDPDDVELNAAKSEVQAEKASDGAAPGADATTGQDPANPPPPVVSGQPPVAGLPPPQQQQQRDAPTMIPKPRLDEALSERDKAKQEAAYWQGVAKAREPAAPAQAGQQPPAPAQATPEQKLSTIHAAQDALATRFDAGEITMAEFKREERKLNNDEQAIREDQLAAKLRPAASSPSGGNDELYLNTLTAQLENNHPWVTVFDQVGTDADWDYLKVRAIENLTTRGIDPTKGANGRYELRKEISVLADELGPGLVGARATAKGIALPGAQPPAKNGQQPPQLSPMAQARADKLRLAGGAPPDISSMNGHNGAGPGDAPTDAAIEAMSEEQYDRLSPAQRSKLLGISA